jgi:rhodanese-related sulfurtransferase
MRFWFTININLLRGKKMPDKRSKAAPKKGLPVWIIGLVVIFLLAVGGAILVLSQPQATVAPLPAEITVGQAAELQKNGAFILDVREPSEWTQFHIQGATLIPLGSLPTRLSEVPKNRQIVVYCRTGVRSAQGRDILKNAGYTQVTSITGGITQWQAQRMPTVTGQ